ncbi:MAG: sulfate adenylyltransferase subunit 1, partial [Cyclobacteriaceae bacterium]
RFTTAGSVDDGNRTLIGRLLYDTGSVPEDQLKAIKDASEQKGFDFFDLSLLTDGLRAERDQGITIDVAYRFFDTLKRRYIIADSPGHFQYTRNMVTGASNADLIIILADAEKGVVEQTKRHLHISALLNIPQLIVCVNKMDLVNYAEEAFYGIVSSLKPLIESLSFKQVHYVPVAALTGEQVVTESTHMPWYNGKTLLGLLEEAECGTEFYTSGFRFPVQYVICPKKDDFKNFRGYAGRIESGCVKIGDKITVLPSGFGSKVTGIFSGSQSLEEAQSPMSVTLTIEGDIDAGRGSLLTGADKIPAGVSEIEIMLCWLNTNPCKVGKRAIIRHHTMETKGLILQILYKLEFAERREDMSAEILNINDLGRVIVKTAQPLFADSYKTNKVTGSLLLIDEITGDTLAAGMVL